MNVPEIRDEFLKFIPECSPLNPPRVGDAGKVRSPQIWLTPRTLRALGGQGGKIIPKLKQRRILFKFQIILLNHFVTKIFADLLMGVATIFIPAGAAKVKPRRTGVTGRLSTRETV